MTLARPELLLYLHIPFCSSKCHFCFKMHRQPRNLLLNGKLHEQYVLAMTKSISHYGPLLAEKYETVGINWGGGTPTILEADQIERVAEALKPYWDLAQLHFSVESTPEALTVERLRVLRAIGVNRLSIGIQSFNDATLKRMGRHHDAATAHAAFKRARASGFSNINLDLILSLPGETVADAVHSAQTAIALSPEHITTYFYNPAPNTVLLRQILAEPALYWDLFSLMECLASIRSRLESAGYRHYEFFHWSRDPQRWPYVSIDHYFGHVGDVFGFGANAQSFLAPNGNLEMFDLADFLSDPISMRPGKFDLEYALERSLGCRHGLCYADIARTFGMLEDAIRDHAFTRSLSHVPGVQETSEGLRMTPEDYVREHTLGLHTRLQHFQSLSPADRQRVTALA